MSCFTVMKIAPFCLLFLTALPLTACLHPQGTPIERIRVIDGDTVEILIAGQDSQRVRMQGIDAPEKNQAFGKKSTQTLKDCVADQPLSLIGDKKDRYGRIVGIVMAGNTDCNLNQIQKGMAWHYKAYQKEQSPENQSLYADAETKAKKSKVGLWSDKCPVAPWDFRKKIAVCNLD